MKMKHLDVPVQKAQTEPTETITRFIFEFPNPFLVQKNGKA